MITHMEEGTKIDGSEENQENDGEMEIDEEEAKGIRILPSSSQEEDTDDQPRTRKWFRVPSGMYEGKVAWTNHPCVGDLTRRVTFYVLGRDARSSMPIKEILGAMENALQLTADEQEAITALGKPNDKPKRERPPKNSSSSSTARSSGSSSNNPRHLISTYGIDEADILPPANEPGEERRSGRALKPNTLFLDDDVVTTLHRTVPSQPTKPVTLIAEILPSSSVVHAKTVSKVRSTGGGAAAASSNGGGGDVDGSHMVRKYIRVPQGVYTGRIAWISHVQDREQLGDHALCVNVLRMGPDRPSGRTTVVASFIRDHWDDDLMMTGEEQEAVQAAIDGTTFRGTTVSSKSTGSSGSVVGGGVAGGTIIAVGVKMEDRHPDMAAAHRLLALSSMTGPTHSHAPSHARGVTSNNAGIPSLPNSFPPHTSSLTHLTYLQTHNSNIL